MNVSLMPFDRLQPAQLEAWSNLLKSAPGHDSPFLRPEYAQLVQEVCGDVEVALVGNPQAPSALFAFQRDRRDVGWPVGKSQADVQGMAGQLGPQESLEELLRSIGLTTLHFDHILSDLEVFTPHVQYTDEAPFIDLTGGFEQYVSDRRAAGSSIISQLERKKRHLERALGPLRLVFRTEDPLDLGRLTEWKHAQLLDKHQPDVFREPWVARLIEGIAGCRTTGLEGVLSSLYAGDRLVALHLGLLSGNVLASYIPTFSAAHQKFSPGAILHLELVRSAAGQGIGRIDLGRGANRLKQRLASGAYQLAIGSADLHPWSRLLNGGWYRARRLVHALPWGQRSLRIYRRLKQRAAASQNTGSLKDR